MAVLSKEELVLMRQAGRIAARVLAGTGSQVRAGMRTCELDDIACELTRKEKAQSAPLGYKGYPKSICTSINHCICHGVPGDYVLQDGDIVNIDITCIKDGFHGDTSRTFYVGEVSESTKSVVQCAYQAMLKGILQVKAGGTTGDIGFAIDKYVTRKGFYPVQEIGGHGIGRGFHEEPFVPSVGKKGKGVVLKAGQCITIEPMVNETSCAIKEFPIANSEIKYYETGDRSLSAQFEHTVLVTNEGYEILTTPPADFIVGY